MSKKKWENLCIGQNIFVIDTETEKQQDSDFFFDKSLEENLQFALNINKIICKMI